MHFFIVIKTIKTELTQRKGELSTYVNKRFFIESNFF